MTPWLWLVLVVVLFAGGLFGYDQGVISGALRGIKSPFTLSPLVIEVVTSWVTLGALFGSLAGGELADQIGRKRRCWSRARCSLSARLCRRLSDTVILVAGRLVVGAGVGVAAVAAPLYAAELAPAAVRGRFVSCYQLAIAIGVFLAYLVDGWLSPSGAWRVMLGASAVPGLLLFAVALGGAEIAALADDDGRRSEAAAELRGVSAGVDVEPPLDAIAKVLRQEGARASWAKRFTGNGVAHLAISVGLAVFRQVTGIDAIIYYADQISPPRASPRRPADVGDHMGDRRRQRRREPDRHRLHRSTGRRKLLLAGLIGMGISLVVVGVAFQFIVKDAAGAAATAGPSAAASSLCSLWSASSSASPFRWGRWCGR